MWPLGLEFEPCALNYHQCPIFHLKVLQTSSSGVGSGLWTGPVQDLNPLLVAREQLNLKVGCLIPVKCWCGRRATEPNDGFYLKTSVTVPQLVEECLDVPGKHVVLKAACRSQQDLLLVLVTGNRMVFFSFFFSLFERRTVDIKTLERWQDLKSSSSDRFISNFVIRTYFCDK